MKEREFVKVNCSGCGRYLLEAAVNTYTYCNECGEWTKAIKGEVKEHQGKG